MNTLRLKAPVFTKIVLLYLMAPVLGFGQTVIDGKIIVEEFSKDYSFQELSKALPSADHDLKVLSEKFDPSGQVHSRYQVQMNGLSLKGLHITTHELKESKRILRPFSIPEISQVKNQQAKINSDEARILAKAKVPANIYAPLGFKGQSYEENVQLLYVPKNYDWDQKEWLLAYEVDVYTQEPLGVKRVTLDAQTGEEIFIENRLCSLHDEGTAVTRYHGTQSIQTTFQDSTYILLDQTRGEGIQTFNVQTEDDFYDTDNFWDNANDDFDEVAGDVHWGSAQTWDFYFENFDRLSIDGEGGKVNSQVHLDDANAYWDGNQTLYGDGGGSLDLPFTYIDIIGHEMTHGVTQHTAALIYIRESGGLNEAFSDILGVSIENYSIPGAVDWRLGEQLSSSGNIIRNMADPHDLNMPTTYGGFYWEPDLEVHSMSSLANLWYFLTVVGGHDTNDHGYAYDVTGIGWEDAQQIAYYTLANYLRPNSNYRQCAEFSVIVASDLFGPCSQQALTVKDAWRAVAVLPEIDEFTSTASKRKLCSLGDSVSFRLNLPVLDVLWDFGDGNTSSEINPTHVYNQNGEFSFSATGTTCEAGAFAISGTHLIIVNDTLSDCNEVVIVPNQDVDLAFCDGAFTDDGGTDGNYSNNYFSNVLVEAPGAKGYNVEFVSFRTRNDEDILQIRVDNGSGLRSVGNFSGTVQPQTRFYEGSRINFAFTSSESFNDEGFEMRWQCFDSLPVPTAAPTASTGNCSYDIRFEANATFSSNVRWDFGDGNNGNGVTTTHTYGAPGIYHVSCRVRNSSGEVTETFDLEVTFPEIVINGPFQILADTPNDYEAMVPDGLVLASGIWRIDGDFSGVGPTNTIEISDLGIYEMTLTAQFSNLCADIDTFYVEVVDELSDIKNPAEKYLHVFPNPTSHFFLVKNNDLLEGNWNIHLINNLGEKLVSFQKFFDSKDKTEFVLPKLNSGLYFLEFENGFNQRHVQKLMILQY